MLTKAVQLRAKAVGAEGEGTFEALVSKFGNIDSYGDVVMVGAFGTTLAEWKQGGDPIPFLWNHDLADPFSHIGVITEAWETEQGLRVKGQLDLSNPKAAQVYKLMKDRRVVQFSFGYKIREKSYGERDGQGIQELHAVELIEVSVTLVGANPETELLDVKSDGVEIKAGRTLSAKNEELVRAAHAALGELLEAITTATEDPKAHAGLEAKDEEPAPEPPAKSEADPAASAVKSLEAYIHALDLEGITK